MVTGQSIRNDNNQNNSMNETANQDKTMLEVDGQADNTNMELNNTLDHSVGEESDVDVPLTTEKIRQYYSSTTNKADAGDARDTVDTEKIFDTLETADTANIDETPDTSEQSDFTSEVIYDYLRSVDRRILIRLVKEKIILVDRILSRRRLNKTTI